VSSTAELETVPVVMLTDVTGTRDGRPWPGRGRIAHVPAREAEELVASGYAEPADAASARREALTGRDR
jgi:hypothetical protein